MKSFSHFYLTILILMVIPFLSGCGSISAGAGGDVEPGGTLNFRTEDELHVLPDSIVSDSSFTSPPFGFAIANDDTVPLSSHITASYSFGRSSATIIQSNEFTIQPGNYGSTLINAQFGGTINIGGFLALIGVGTAEMDIDIRILDITNGVESGRVIAVQPVDSYNITNGMELAMGVAIGAQVGSATVGQGGIDLGIEVGVPFERIVVRESKDFGFTVMLRRGHTYLFQVISKSKLELGATGGRGIVTFYSPLAPIPDGIVDPIILAVPPQILDTGYWLDTLNWPLLDQEIPAITLPANGSRFTLPARTISIPLPTGTISIRIPGVSPGIRAIYPSPFQSVRNTNDILEVLGFNTNMKDILAHQINRHIPGEEILFRGVELKDLSMDLDNDDTSDLKYIKDRI